jgi:hypothetical protein
VRRLPTPYRRSLCGLFTAAAIFCSSAARADDPGAHRILDRTEYATRLRALWLGECIANWTGLRTEGLVSTPPFLTDADWGTSPFPDRPWAFLDVFLWDNPWKADDDTDVEYVYLHAMHTLGVNRLTPDQIASQWIDHINSYIWVSNAAARALMSAGVKPPMTALAQGLDPAAPADSSLMIDAQLTTEMFGVLCPGMPDRALQMADLPIRTTARGHAMHAAQFYALCYSLASQVDRSSSGRQQAIWLVQEARKYIPDSSKAADIIDFVLADFLANPDPDDWESTRDRVYQRYQGDATANGFVYRAWYESSTNLACGVMALLYGQMDFVRTIQIGTLSGWDSDNGTATMGGLVAFVQGQAFLDMYSWVSDNFWITRTRDDLPDYTPGPTFDGEDTFTLMARRMLPIIDREVVAAGGCAAVGPASPSGAPAGTWLLPPGGAGPGVSHALALARSPSQQEFARSANWSVRLAGGSVTPSTDVPGAPEAGYGWASPGFIADGLESDARGLEEFGSPRGYCSTQRAGGNTPATPQFFTVTYDRPVQVHTIRFIGGRTFQSGSVQGGWYESVTPQVLVGGEWQTPALALLPPASTSSFAIQDFVLAAPVFATGVRVVGLPGGQDAFVTCMELDALAPPPDPMSPTFDLSGDGRRSIDDLYAWHAQPVDLDADGTPSAADLDYLERAVRFNELGAMVTGRH